MNLVIVESPAKAKTIQKYLGSGYEVLASYGHVRDLPSKDGSVRPDEDFAMDWDVEPKAAKRLKDIASAVKRSKKLILATDPDREGEAISWHVLEFLRDKGLLNKIAVERVAFNAITKGAVQEAIAHPRQVDQELVSAYLARRALDYLVGFTLSPVLWRKVPGSRSAGRVQSVALRLVCDRELEIERFRPQEYWSVTAKLDADGQGFDARLVEFEERKLKRLDIADQGTANRARDLIKAHPVAVGSVESKPHRRNPPAPFTTSTLQQEASRKLGFSASRTMSVAQRLYEGVDLGGETVGLITYMRTDGVQITPEAVEAMRSLIRSGYGAKYLPEKAREYRSKAKNAQEAHEAIRPTDAGRRPEDVQRHLDQDQARLYELIWKRSLASQMESAEMERTTVDIVAGGGKATLRATGTVIVFDGFLTLYQEGEDDPQGDDDARRLPPLKAGQTLKLLDVIPQQHFTEPPPRYTEATLVKRLEELGIGRPSTYASILSVLRDRNYVRMDKSRFVPEDKGRIVTAFLESFFMHYVEYDFTAGLEEKLDQVSAGELDWKVLLRDFWRDFASSVEGIKDLKVSDVLDALNDLLAPHIFPDKGDGSDPRLCPNCGEGRLSLKLGKFGAFIGCSRYPDCNFTRQMGVPDKDGANGQMETRVLGEDPASGLQVTLRSGRFGPYLQLGEGAKDDKPKRASIPKDIALDSMTLETALKLLSLPREVGKHPESHEPITANIGRFGPYVHHKGQYANLDSTEEVFSVGVNRAVTLLAEKAAGGNRRPSARVLKTLGNHPDDGKPVEVKAGRFGPYVTHGGVNATLPRGTEPEAMTLDEALPLLAARAAAGPSRKGKPARKAKKDSPKPKAESAPAPKAPPRKAAAKAAKAPAKSKPATKPKAKAAAKAKVKR